MIAVSEALQNERISKPMALTIALSAGSQRSDQRDGLEAEWDLRQNRKVVSALLIFSLIQRVRSILKIIVPTVHPEAWTS